MSEKKEYSTTQVVGLDFVSDTLSEENGELLKDLDTGETFGQKDWDENKVQEFYNQLSQDAVDFLMDKTGHGKSLTDLDELSDDLKYFLSKMITMSDDRVLKIFEDTMDAHDGDVNFPPSDWKFITKCVSGEIDVTNDPLTMFKAKLTAVLFYYHSVYPEVRAITDAFEENDEPCETIRSYTISIIWLIVAAGVNEFFSHRRPSITLTSSVLSILMYPCGKLWELIMPNAMVPWFGGKIPLNPGRYTYKEQMFATILSGVSGTSVYVSYNIVTQRMFFKEKWVDFGFQFLLTMSTQCLGLAFAGILRKFCIYPSRAVWPTLLPTIALNRALLRRERKESIHGWKISSYNFFWIVFGSMFLYFWIPNYLFQAVSYFNWTTWIKPSNFNLAAITGTVGGLGLNPITTFDWNNISYIINPLAVPWTTIWNTFLGSFVGLFVIVGIYYSNYKWTAYLPINSNDIFTNTGESYEVTEILTNGVFDREKYQAYSPPFYTAANIVIYGAFFAVYPLSFFYNSYKEWKTIVKAYKMMIDGIFETFRKWSFKSFISVDSSSYEKFHDPNSRMMRKFKEVPDWYYVVILLVSFIFAILTVEVYTETKTPVWGIFFVIAINFVFLIPFSVLFATTGVQLGLNVLVELIIGYALQGNGVALMTLKALGYNIDGQADTFVSSMKLGHYSRIPPRSIFRAQIIGTVIQAFVFLGVVNWSMSNIENFCEPDQDAHFSCPNERTFYAAAVLWGVIGPKIVFSGLYPTMQYAFLMGFGIAILFIGMKYFAKNTSWYKKIHSFEPTLFINGILNVYAPYNLGFVTPALYVGFIFMYYIKKRYIAWFEKYNYILAAGLSAGVAFSAIIIFFAVQYHNKSINWWGNLVSYAGIDGGNGQQSLYDVTDTPRGYFGPEIGHYPVP
jgi:OPT family small oligopeptide transporter